MIVLDTSGLLAALDSSERTHAAAREVLERESGPLLLSPFVLAELDYLIGSRDLEAEIAMLRDVGDRAYELMPITSEDIDRAAHIVERYRDLRIGLADASIVLLAERAGTKRLLTLDERHFRALRPLGGGRFTLLPQDARPSRG